MEWLMVREIIRLKRLTNKVVWTRGHANNSNNIDADALANTTVDFLRGAEIKGFFREGCRDITSISLDGISVNTDPVRSLKKFMECRNMLSSLA
jgi:hypothetical protein